MTIDEQDEVYKEGFNAGVEHQNMSPETKTQFKELHTLIQTHIGNEDEKFNSLIDMLNKLHLDFSEFRIETKTKLDYIQEQTTKTNGRVTGLEGREKDYKDTLLTWLIRVVFGAIGALALSVLEVTGVINLFK